MLNLLSYLGMSLQSELCVWNMVGLVTTIFDATLFKVNANLKQVWAMDMPSELSMSVQRGLRTMISGIMLVQCFTVYIYLASYIVMLYPIYLEERPSLLLPWLLLAAVKKLLCELMSLTLGLGTCVLIGPARSACIKFVVSKIAALLPAFYMWMLVFSYYNTLKLPNAFLKFPVVRPVGSDQDYRLELAVRRRRTKSLLDEKQLRSRLLQSISNSRGVSKDTSEVNYHYKHLYTAGPTFSDISVSGAKNETDIARPFSIGSNIEWMEDWFGSEIAMPRDSDRVVNQFSLMLLRIAAFINSGESDTRKFLQSQNTKLSCDDESIIKRSSCRSTYRKSEVPTVKSDEAVVIITRDSTSQKCSPKSSNEGQHLTQNPVLASITKYEREAVLKGYNSKEKKLSIDRVQKAKSLKLNKMLRRRRPKRSTKVKVSQSIIDMINQCSEDVQEKLMLKKVVNSMSFVDTKSNHSSTSSIISAGPVVINLSTSDLTSGNTSTYNAEEIKRTPGIDKAVSTHDKVVAYLQKKRDNLSSREAMSTKAMSIEKNIGSLQMKSLLILDDNESICSEEVSQENIDEYSSTTSSSTSQINSKDISSSSLKDYESIALNSEVESQITSIESKESINGETSKKVTKSSDIQLENVEIPLLDSIEQPGYSNARQSRVSIAKILLPSNTESNFVIPQKGNKLENSSNTSQGSSQGKR